MRTAIFSLAALSLIGILVAGIGKSFSDYGQREAYKHDDDDRWEHMMRKSTGVAGNTNPLYIEECGSCHMAYPPGLLPSTSWQRIMATLDDHFGDNAELDDMTGQQLSQYLIANAANQSGYRRSRQLAAADKTGMRITDNPYFRHEHNEIPDFVIRKSGAASLSHCNACHQGAERGNFSEHGIWIKGIGRWDD